MDWRTFAVTLVACIVVSAVVGYLASYAAIMHATVGVTAQILTKELEAEQRIDEAVKRALGEISRVEAEVARGASKVLVSKYNITYRTYTIRVIIEPVEVRGSLDTAPPTYAEWFNGTIYVNNVYEAMNFSHFIPDVRYTESEPREVGVIRYTGPELASIKVVYGHVGYTSYFYVTVKPAELINPHPPDVTELELHITPVIDSADRWSLKLKLELKAEA